MSSQQTNLAQEAVVTQTDSLSTTRPINTEQKRERFFIVVSLVALYILWGSTYLGMEIAMRSFPPFLMAGIRFVLAGAIMLTLLLVRKAPLPTRKEWIGAVIVGVFLLVGGNAGVALAEQWVPTGLSAVAIGAVPLWVALFAGLLGRWPKRIEWVGLALGFSGLVLLNLGHGISTNVAGNILLLTSPLCWATGSILSQRLPMPKGGMSSAAQMLCAGVVLLVLALGSGEHMTSWPTPASIWAMLFLILGGSLVAFTSYMYLLNHVRPALATSYAYVNPVIAVALGVWLIGEQVTISRLIAMSVTLCGVVLVTVSQGQKK